MPDYSGYTRITNADGSTHTVDRRAKLNRFAEMLAARGPEPSRNPELNVKRTPVAFAIPMTPRPLFDPAGQSASLPKKAYGTPREYVPGHGSKHTKIRYREDWSADGSGWSDLHDLVAGDRNDAAAYAAKEHDADLCETERPENPGAKGNLIDLLARGMYASDSSDRPWTPTTTRRELQQRLSKRQRRMMKAYELWRSGKTWRQVAQEMGEPRHVVYAWRLAIKSMIGGAMTTRENHQPRQGGRFVGRVRVLRNDD